MMISDFEQCQIRDGDGIMLEKLTLDGEQRGGPS